jgi:hypothetical protein
MAALFLIIDKADGLPLIGKDKNTQNRIMWPN